MRLGGRDIGLVELDWRARKSALGIASLALQARSRSHCGGDDVRLVVGLQIGIDVRLLFGVGDANSVGGGFGCFEGVRHSQRDVLTVVADDVIFKWGTPLVGDTFESLSLNRAEDFADVLAMKDRSHAGHFLRCNDVEFGYFAVGDRCLDRHAIEQARKMEVRSVLRLSGYLERAIYPPRVATNG